MNYCDSETSSWNNLSQHFRFLFDFYRLMENLPSFQANPDLFHVHYQIKRRVRPSSLLLLLAGSYGSRQQRKNPGFTLFEVMQRGNYGNTS